MEITYLGHSSFKIRGKKATLVTDPFDEEMVGIKFPKLDSIDIVTVSHPHLDHSDTKSINGNPLIISGPGEYEVKGARIYGIQTYHDSSQGKERGKNTVYHIEMDGISIIHCGDIGHKFNDKEIELLDGVGLLFVPVGGVWTVTASQAVEIVSQLEPRIIIPMHYKTSKHKQESFAGLAEVGIFLKEMGKEGVLPVDKLNITKDKLPVEPTIVFIE